MALSDGGVKPPRWLHTSDFSKTKPGQKAARNFVAGTFRILTKNYARILFTINDYETKQQQYHEFKKQHDLPFDPIYEPSKLFAIGTLGLFVTGESLGTAWFFKKITDNLIDAAIKALSLSVINVTLGTFIGYFLIRYLIHNSRFHRIWAAPLLLLFLPFSVIYIFALGFYRQSASIDTTGEAKDFSPFIWQAIQSISTSNYPSLSTESVVLIVGSFIIFILAIVKGIYQEHPYPKFKEQYEALQNAEYAYFELAVEVNKHMADLQTILNDDIKDLHINPIDQAQLISWQTRAIEERLCATLYKPIIQS